MPKLEGPDKHFRFSFLKNNFIYLFIYFWLCWAFVAAPGFSLAAAGEGCSLAVVHGLLIGVTSLVAEPGSRVCGLQ